MYASADARKVHDILTRLGGVRPEDATLLIGGSANCSRRSRGWAAPPPTPLATGSTPLSSSTIRPRQGRRASLGETRIGIDALKSLIATAPSTCASRSSTTCRSGAITRSKGARKTPAFESKRTTPATRRGSVILTSSASDEDSQESDIIGGSSHHLASGLLGGANGFGDGRVTLFEAYAYASNRTVADTADSAASTQHPTFSYDLAGNGDLILTDVAVRHEGIYVPRDTGGVYFLVNGKELHFRRGMTRGKASTGGWRFRPGAMGSAPPPNHLRIGGIDVPPGRLVALEEGRLRDAPFSDNPVKGGARVELTGRWSLGAGATYQSVFSAPNGASSPPTGLSTLRSATFCAATGSSASISPPDRPTAS